MQYWNSLNLRGRLMILLMAAITTIVGSTSAFFIVRQQRLLSDELRAKSAAMRDALAQKGLTVAGNVALASERAVVLKEYLFLAQILDNIVGHDPEFAFGTFVDNRGVALVHTDPKQGGHIQDPALLAAIAATTDTGHVADAAGQLYKDTPVLLVTAPITVAGKRWGVVCLGLSLTNLNKALSERADEITHQMQVAIGTGVAVTALLGILGIALASLAASSLTKPLNNLMDGVRQIGEGHMDYTVITDGSPEFVALASGFNEMTLAVRRREAALQSALEVAAEANRLKSEFLANISHELRTPLNAIINVPQALLEDFALIQLWECPECDSRFEAEPGTLPEAQEACPNCAAALRLRPETVFRGQVEEHRLLNIRALQSSQHLLRVVNDLLDFSRMQAGKMEIVSEAIALDVLCAEISDTMKSLADAKQIRLQVPPTASLASIALTADRVKLSQILINLLANAIKFSPAAQGVQLHVYSERDGQTPVVHFAVQDHGIGIPKDKQDIIFEPFRQVDGSHTRRYGGTGLGLTITSQLVQLHGGRLWVESEPGKGSTFHVLLPAEPTVLEHEPTREQLGAPQVVASFANSQLKRIVLIDDEEIYLELGRRILGSAGLQVDVCMDPHNAEKLIDAAKPDLIVVDVMMPNISGIDILRRLKAAEATRHIPVLVSTAFYANKKIVTELGGLWLPKPWDLQGLMDCLGKHGILENRPALPVAEKTRVEGTNHGA